MNWVWTLNELVYEAEWSVYRKSERDAGPRMIILCDDGRVTIECERNRECKSEWERKEEIALENGPAALGSTRAIRLSAFVEYIFLV